MVIHLTLLITGYHALGMLASSCTINFLDCCMKKKCSFLIKVHSAISGAICTTLLLCSIALQFLNKYSPEPVLK